MFKKIIVTITSLSVVINLSIFTITTDATTATATPTATSTPASASTSINTPTTTSNLPSGIIKIDAAKYSLDLTGRSDCTASFQKMVNSFQKGTTIYLPAGIYKINGTVTLKDGISLMSSNNARILGSWNNTLFNTGNDNSFAKIHFENCAVAIKVFYKKNVNVDECMFVGHMGYAAIYYYGSSNCTIKNSFFYSIDKYGVLIDGACSDITIRNSTFDNYTKYDGYKTEQIGGHVYCLNGTRINVSYNVLKNSGGQGVIFCFNSSTGKGTTDSIASYNLCQGNGQEGATIYGGSKKLASGNSLIGNRCIDNRFNQIEIWQAKDCIVKDNTASEPTSGTGNLGAITLYQSDNITCTGNKVLSAQNNGIDIAAGSKKCTVSNNAVSNTNLIKDVNAGHKGNGILLDSCGSSQPEYITITNNTINSTIGTIKKSAVYSTSATNHHNTISGNICSGYSSGIHYYAWCTVGK